MSKRKTLEQFIEEARLVHGDAYDYSMSEYVRAKDKIKIKCNVCGNIFYQTPINHLYQKSGCPKCGQVKWSGNRRSNTEEFISKAMLVHNGLYDYSLVDYVKNNIKVTIKCNTCGKIFEQSPQSHLAGHGCTECEMKRGNIPRRKGQDAFILEATQLHNGKYDYSKVNYITSSDPVVITCPKHGDFKQTPRKHLQGQQCPMCSYEESLGRGGLINRGVC